MESLKRRFIYTESPILVDIYYGTGTTTTVTSDTIISTFSTESGLIGLPYSSGGRVYTFGVAFNTYRFWAIPDVPSGITYGNKIISRSVFPDNSTVLAMQPAEPFYSYYQSDPTPSGQMISYGKMTINGIIYRLYRTSYKFSSSNIQFLIYSF